jgi:hypothetical protein
MFTLGTAVRIKDGKRGRPKKWYIIQFTVGDDVMNDLVVLENEKHEQITVGIDDVVPYPLRVGKLSDVPGGIPLEAYEVK